MAPVTWLLCVLSGGSKEEAEDPKDTRSVGLSGREMPKPPSPGSPASACLLRLLHLLSPGTLQETNQVVSTLQTWGKRAPFCVQRLVCRHLRAQACMAAE